MGIAEAVTAPSDLLSTLPILANSLLLRDCQAPGGFSLPEGAGLANTQGRPERPRSERPEAALNQ